MSELKLPGGYRMEFKPGQKGFDAKDNWEPHWNVFRPDGRHVCSIPEYEAEAFAAAMTRPVPERHNELREAWQKIVEQAARAASAIVRPIGFSVDQLTYADGMVKGLVDAARIVEAALAEQAAPVKEGE